MNCNGKTTLKLSSNIIEKSVGSKQIGSYLPPEFIKAKAISDPIIKKTLPERLRNIIDKRLFWTDDVWNDDERFPDKKENSEMCKNCEHRDICY